MRFYADKRSTSFRQLISDLFVVGWVAFWVWASFKVYATVLKLAAPGKALEDAGTNMAGGLSDAGDKVDNVPAVGGQLATPFDKAAAAAQSIADAGRAQQDAVHNLAIAMVVLMLVVPTALVLFVWLPLRIRWIRRASIAWAQRRDRPGRDLLALRALSNQPMRKLISIHPDPAAAWRENDSATIQMLAGLELKTLGLRPPAPQ